MSERDESSYYEIALTNRQVLLTFVVLLAMVAGSFFFGLMVGRRGAVEPAEGATVAGDARQRHELTFLREAGGTTESRADATSERASGIDELLPPASRRAATASPSPAATPLPPVNRTLVDIIQPSPPSSPSPSPAPASASPVAPPAPVPATATATTTPGGAAAPGGEFAVQVLTTSDAAKANELVRRLRARGISAYVTSAPATDRGALHKVRVGPFASREAAQRVADDLRSSEKLDTWVTR